MKSSLKLRYDRATASIKSLTLVENIEHNLELLLLRARLSACALCMPKKKI